MTIFEGVLDLLSYFKKKGRILSVCTNRNCGSLERILNKYNMFQYFDNVISCADAGHEKLDPHCLNALISKYPEFYASKVIYFGDSKTDADFAKNAGIDYLVIDHYINSKKYYSLILNIFSNFEEYRPTSVESKNNELSNENNSLLNS